MSEWKRSYQKVFWFTIFVKFKRISEREKREGKKNEMSSSGRERVTIASRKIKNKV